MLETFKHVLGQHVLQDTVQRREKMPVIEFMVGGYQTGVGPRAAAVGAADVAPGNAGKKGDSGVPSAAMGLGVAGEGAGRRH